MTGDSELRDTLLGGLGWTSLTISVDLPLVTSEMIDLIVERYARCNKPAPDHCGSTRDKEKAWSRREYVLEAGSRHLIPAGINVIDGRRIDEEEVAVNVNASQDLRIAERLFSEGSCGGINHAG